MLDQQLRIVPFVVGGQFPQKFIIVVLGAELEILDDELRWSHLSVVSLEHLTSLAVRAATGLLDSVVPESRTDEKFLHDSWVEPPLLEQHFKFFVPFHE